MREDVLKRDRREKTFTTKDTKVHEGILCGLGVLRDWSFLAENRKSKLGQLQYTPDTAGLRTSG
jgi:hypothetical protein